MNGDGVEKNVGLAVNWLATAAKKQHAAAQATLGEILWRGQDVRQRQARGLALIILAHENAVASGKEPQWIGDLYREAFGKSDTATRKDAEAMLPELGGVQAASVVPTAKAKPTEIDGGAGLGRGGQGCGSPTASAAADTAPLSKPGAPPPAPIGLSVGFGATRRRETLDGKLDKDRHVVRGLLPAPRRGIDLAGLKPVGRLRRQQQMVDAQALVLLEGAGLIVPERVAVRLVVAGAERVGQAEIDQRLEMRARLRPEQRIVHPGGSGCRRPPAPG